MSAKKDTPTTSSQSILSRLSSKWYLAIILALATIVRFINVTKASIWHDEGYSAMLVQHNFVDIIVRTVRDVHPPLYYLLTRVWTFIFGHSELALRGFSIACGVLAVLIIYFLIRRLVSESAARLAGLFIAIGPFVVRYSQEARMYALATLLAVLSTYLLVRGLTDKASKSRLKYWILYGLVIAAGLYTHYYVGLIIPVHIGYAIYASGGMKTLLKRKDWWLGNLIGLGLFLPWIPVVLAQLGRVQSGFWIPEVTIETVPNTLLQFLVFDSHVLSFALKATLSLGLTVLIVLAIKHASSRNRRAMLLLSAWILVPIALTIIVSLKQPVYVDRYFVYSSVALYALFAVMITSNQWLKSHRVVYTGVIVGVCLIFVGGLVNVSAQANHKMRQAGAYVSSNFQSGDMLVSGELYTYFDFSYYNHTGEKLRLLSQDPMSGYGETSLLYDDGSIRLAELSDITPSASRVWIIGKTGDKPYFQSGIPVSWSQLDQFETGDIAIHLYKTKPVQTTAPNQ